MGMILSISAGSGSLRVTATGKFSMEEAERTFLEILDAIAQHKTEKVLIDGRGLKGEPRSIERFFYGEFAAHAVWRCRARGVLGAPQFAYVLQEPMLDTERFGETAAVNRGMWIKVFDNLDDAIGWLNLAPANNPDAGDAKERA